MHSKASHFLFNDQFASIKFLFTWNIFIPDNSSAWVVLQKVSNSHDKENNKALHFCFIWLTISPHRGPVIWKQSICDKHQQTHITNPTMHQADIAQCTICNRNVHTCAHFCYSMVHCGIWDWRIVGFVQQVYTITLIRHCGKQESNVNSVTSI